MLAEECAVCGGRLEKLLANAQRGNVNLVTTYAEKIFNLYRRRFRNYYNRIGNFCGTARQWYLVAPYRAKYVLRMAHEVTIMDGDDCSRTSRRQQHW